MPRIVEEKGFNGVLKKIERLGLADLVEELRVVLTRFRLEVMERVDSNGGAALRMMIDERFRKLSGWTMKQTGDVDWSKCNVVNGTRACIGIEVQDSARSDLLV